MLIAAATGLPRHSSRMFTLTWAIPRYSVGWPIRQFGGSRGRSASSNESGSGGGVGTGNSSSGPPPQVRTAIGGCHQ